jgi:hypothetical protein
MAYSTISLKSVLHISQIYRLGQRSGDSTLKTKSYFPHNSTWQRAQSPSHHRRVPTAETETTPTKERTMKANNNLGVDEIVTDPTETNGKMAAPTLATSQEKISLDDQRT